VTGVTDAQRRVICCSRQWAAPRQQDSYTPLFSGRNPDCLIESVVGPTTVLEVDEKKGHSPPLIDDVMGGRVGSEVNHNNSLGG
jgi:hypothetical protein